MLLDGEFNVTRIISADKFEYQAPKLLRPEQYYNALSIDRTHEGNIKNESYYDYLYSGIGVDLNVGC